MLPNLLIVGVNKSGTTSLFNYLVSHPDVCGSAIKETFYFTPLIWDEALPPQKQYEAQFENCGSEKWIMEATPRYFFGGEKVAQAIKETCPDSKIIILFREPVSRLFSFYLFKKRTLDLEKTLTFESYIQNCLKASKEEKMASPNKVLFGMDESTYIEQLPSWYDTFGDKHVKILFQDDLLNNPGGVMEDVAQFLEIDAGPFYKLEFARENKAQGYKNAGLQKVARKIFKRFERFWTSNPKLKRKLAAVYYAVNGSSKKERLAAETKAMLTEHFEESNTALANYLNSKGYSALPEWLKPH